MFSITLWLLKSRFSGETTHEVLLLLKSLKEVIEVYSPIEYIYDA